MDRSHLRQQMKKKPDTKHRKNSEMEEVRESMAIVKDAAAIELIWNLIRGKTDGISRVTFFPQKPDFPEASPCPQPLERASAESQGIESSRIREMLERE